MNPQLLIEKYWPWVREICVSPLSKGDDKICAWQAEVLMANNITLSREGEDCVVALLKLDADIPKAKSLWIALGKLPDLETGKDSISETQM